MRVRAPLLAAVAAVLATANSIPGGFTLDDPVVIAENPHVVAHDLGRILVSPYHAGSDQATPTGLYRPLTTASFALNHAIGGLRPSGYHVVNVLLHGANSGLAAAVGAAAGLAGVEAIAAGLLFAVHPVHSEAVASVAGRGELLSAFFFLLALLAWARGEKLGGSRERLPTAALAAVLSFLAMASKEQAVVFPAVAVVWSLALGRRRRDLIRDGALLALAAAGYLALRVAVIGGLALPHGAVTRIENPAFGLPVLERLSTAAAAGSRYLGLLVFPRALSPDYSFAETAPVASFADPRAAAGALAACLLVLALALLWRRRPAASVALGLGLATFAPVSNVAIVIGTLIAERLLYLPSVGACLLAGMAWGGISRWAHARVATAAGLALLAVSAGRLAWADTAWRDDFTLWSRAFETAPRSVRVLGNLAVELGERGRNAEARGLLERAIALAPDLSVLRLNLAAVLLADGDLRGAEAEVRSVLVRDPANALAWLQLATVREASRDDAGTEEALRRAVTARPGLLAARLKLARFLARQGDEAGARAELRAAEALAPGSEAVVRAIRELGGT